MKKLINLNTETRPAIEIHVTKQLSDLNDSLALRVNQHIQLYSKFWNSQHRPADQLAAMGPYALQYLMAAQESISHITKLIEISNIGRGPEDQVTLDEVLPVVFREPRIPFLVSELGVVTLGEIPEGLDDWGNPIVEVPVIPPFIPPYIPPTV